MMKSKLLCALLIVLAGCSTCKRCHGQTVLDATGVAEFNRVFVMALNQFHAAVSADILKTCLNVASLPDGTSTISVKDADYKRVLDASTTTSLVARLIAAVGAKEASQQSRIGPLTAHDRRVYEAVVQDVGTDEDKAIAKRAVDFYNLRAASITATGRE